MPLFKTDRLTLRIGGTVLGGAFLALGGLSVHGAITISNLVAPDRVFWYGVTVLIAGVLSIGFAWLEARPDRVFCPTVRRPGHQLAGPAPKDTEFDRLFAEQENAEPAVYAGQPSGLKSSRTRGNLV
ncbi:MAG: hypothetical protein HOL85_08070 [Rhodospirillaceae bacterium]|jgi:hypothetical protein|nr:hypothetical protein [Rhodospirillaceae bacterium]MBT6138483.1 hypothetical protein [Rhodospirillaceae bacterium]